MLAGRAYLPPTDATAALAAAPRPATLAGALLSPAGRLGPGWLVSREAAAMAPPIPAHPGALWDNRFRLAPDADPPAGATLGSLGADSARLRRLSRLPARVLATLPALRCNESLFAVPHIGYPSVDNCARAPILLAPPAAAAGPRFLALPPEES
jgi:tRNA(Ile)-lysidine synthase